MQIRFETTFGRTGGSSDRHYMASFATGGGSRSISFSGGAWSKRSVTIALALASEQVATGREILRRDVAPRASLSADKQFHCGYVWFASSASLARMSATILAISPAESCGLAFTATIAFCSVAVF